MYYKIILPLHRLSKNETTKAITKEDSVTTLSYISSTAKLAVFLCFYKFFTLKF